MKQILFFLSLVIGIGYIYAKEPDILVTQTGESIKVYNLDITSGDKVYYTLKDSENAPLQKILKSNVLIIKKADGQKLDFSSNVNLNGPFTSSSSFAKVNPGAHDPIITKATEGAFTEIGKIKKKVEGTNKYIHAEDGYGNILNLRLISEIDNTLSVAKPRKDHRYEYEKIFIPEYVEIDGNKYTIVGIDKDAFSGKGTDKIIEIVLPNTLLKIGEYAFKGCKILSKIILPDSIEEVGDFAFTGAGIGSNWRFVQTNNLFEQLYIPNKNIKIGNCAFLWVGPDCSYRGFFQGHLTSLPDWINENNCTKYGIDENAVENYERRIGIRK